MTTTKLEREAVRRWRQSPERKRLNVRLLRRIERHILEEPKRMDMDHWLEQGKEEIQDVGLKVPACNTVGCIMGWAKMLAGDDAKLGIHRDKVNSVYYSWRWPEPYFSRLQKIKTQTKAYAQCVVDRIEHLIATGE